MENHLNPDEKQESNLLNGSKQHKFCVKCGIEQPLLNFHKNKNKKDGLDLYCKSCKHNEYIKRTDYPRRITDLIIEGKKKCGCCGELKDITCFSKAKHRPSGYSNACKSCMTIYQKQYKITNPNYKILSRKTQKKYYDSHVHKTWVWSSFSNHKRKGYDVSNLSQSALYDLAVTTTHCPLCGEELNWDSNKVTMRQNSPTLDRINNENHMTIDNVMIICNRCNHAKGVMPLQDFINYCGLIHRRNI